MKRYSSFFLFCLLVVTPMFAQQRSSTPHVVEVLVDDAANRAYIPFGTILPHGMAIYSTPKGVTWPAKRLPKSDDTPYGDVKRAQALGTSHPLIFEYAPESRFVEARKHRAPNPFATGRLRANSEQCDLTIVQSSQWDQTTNQTIDFTMYSNYCHPDPLPDANTPATYSFEPSINDDSAWVEVYEAYHGGYCHGDSPSPWGGWADCVESNETIRNGAVQTIDVFGFARRILYLNNYEPYFVDHNFHIVYWCCVQ